MKIPDEAAGVAAGFLPHSMDCECSPDPEGQCSCRQPRVNTMHAALEAVAPILLSHELEQTRLAHLDAMVNAQTATRLQDAIDAVLAYGADRREKYIDTGDPKVDMAIRSYAYHMKRIITGALEGRA